MSKYVVYGRPGCQWCEKAINLLVARGFTIEYVNIRASEENMARFKKHHPNATTVPQIDWYTSAGNKMFVGGFRDLEDWLMVDNTGSDI